MKYGKVVKGALVEAPAGAGPSEGWLPVAKRPAPPGAEQAGWRVRSGWVVPAWRKRSIPELPEDPTNAEVVSTVRRLAAAAGCLLLSLMLPAATVQTARNSELRQSSSVVTNVTFEGLLTQHQDISGKADKSNVEFGPNVTFGSGYVYFPYGFYFGGAESHQLAPNGVDLPGGFVWWPSRGGTFAITNDIPTKVSQLQNDLEFAPSNSVPKKTSDLTNDSGFITQASVPTKVSQLQNDSGFATSDAVAEARADFETKVVRAVITNRTYNLIPDHQLGVVWKNTAENGRFFARCYTNDLSVVEGP